MSRLLLLSNSRNYGSEFLAHATDTIKSFLGESPGRLLFVPHAAVTFSYDDYAGMVRSKFAEMGYEMASVHEAADGPAAVAEAAGIIVGGGNTFHLLEATHRTGILAAIRERVKNGAPYIGWSAGANLACPSIKTTNDMPIVEPPSFEALGLVPFQINPHYTDATIEGHGGESRDQRIAEFVAANPDGVVAGLREGSMLVVDGERIELRGDKPLRVFGKGRDPHDYAVGDDVRFLLTSGAA